VARRARHDLPAIQDKRARVVELRAKGHTWQQIAELTGYANASSASKAWHAAIKQHPDQTVAAIRAQEKTRLEQMDSVMSGIISNPPIRATSIGRVMWDPRTCTCGVRGDSKRDHRRRLPDTARFGCLRRRPGLGRAQGYRGVPPQAYAADAAVPTTGHTEDEIRMMAEVIATKRQRPLPAPLPLPAGNPGMSPEDQAAASVAALQSLARYRRAEVIAEGYAAAGQPPPPDARAILEVYHQADDVVDAEIVD